MSDIQTPESNATYQAPKRASISQLAAETLWRIATDDNHDIAWYRSPVYRNAERTFLAALRAEYGLTLLMARKVRDLLAEYGPSDNLMWDTPHRLTVRGVASYVAYAKLPENRGRQF